MMKVGSGANVTRGVKIKKPALPRLQQTTRWISHKTPVMQNKVSIAQLGLGAKVILYTITNSLPRDTICIHNGY